MKMNQMRKILAMLLAAVIAAALLPAGGVKAAPLTYPGTVLPSPCDNFEPASAPYTDYCMHCGHQHGSGSPSTPSSSSSSSQGSTRSNSSSIAVAVPIKSPEEIGRENSIKEQEDQQAAIEALSDAQSTVNTGGETVKSTVDGAYTAKGVEGTVITTSKEQLKENFGLQEGETMNVVTWDVTIQNSPDAIRSLQEAAREAGGELGPAINVIIKKTSSGANPALKTITKALLQDFKGIGPAVGAVNTDDWADYLSDKPDDQSFLAKYNEAMKETLKLDLNSENYANEVKAVFEKYGLGGPDEALSRLEDIRNEVDEFTKARGSAEMTVGVPQNFQSEGSTISVVKVLPGGKTEVLPDKDNNPNTVSFDVTEGEASYALVKKYSKGSTVLGKAGLGLVKYMYDSVNEVATPEEKSLIDNMQKANDEYSALDTSGMNSAEVEDARDAIFQKYGFEDSSDAAEKVGDIMEKYNII